MLTVIISNAEFKVNANASESDIYLILIIEVRIKILTQNENENSISCSKRVNKDLLTYTSSFFPEKTFFIRGKKQNFDPL